MIKIFSPHASRSLDDECIASGMTEGELIASASSAAASIIVQILSSEFPDQSSLRIVIACGHGNNGADGLMIASALSSLHDVTVVCPPLDATVSSGYAYAFSRLTDRVRICFYADLADLSAQRIEVIIDAVLGSGSRIPLLEAASVVTAQLNAISALRIAIDLPTGLDAMTGSIDRHVVSCHHTIAMEGYKPGHIRGSGPEVSGRLHVAQIGAPPQLSDDICDGSILDESDISSILPMRRRVSSKFDYGHVIVIGGTLGMRGAPSMSAHAALAIGAGLVDLATVSVHPLTPREIMTTTLPYQDDGSIAAEAIDTIMARVRRANVVALGPGLGMNHRTISMLAEVIESMSIQQTLVLDADGLRCLPLVKSRKCSMIITPHLGELARLMDVDRTSIEPSYAEHAAHVAEAYDCVVHIKHVPAATIFRRHTTYLLRGNPAMATAGAGDVLTGVISGLCAQGMAPFDAARAGAWLHAAAGDALVARTGAASLMATDLIPAVAHTRAGLTADRN
jgi:NAD(P)H-hydrate epimerase